MYNLIFICLGGALGSALRYILSGWFYKFSDGIFPVGTLAVNLIGSLFIGLLWGLFEDFAVSPITRNFLFIGLLGGFTTFSSFSLENFHLLRDGEIKIAIINVLLSNTGGIALVFVGYFLSRGLLSVFK